MTVPNLQPLGPVPFHHGALLPVLNAVPLHLAHLEQRARQSGDWDGATMAQTDLMQLLHQRIETLDIGQARADVRPLLRDASAQEIWSARYFRDLANRMVCQ